MVSPLIKHDLVLLFLVVSIFRVMQTLQIVLVDIPTDAPALAAARLLVEAEMNPGIDAGVRDIVRDSLELCVVQYHASKAEVDNVMDWRPLPKMRSGTARAELLKVP